MRNCETGFDCVRKQLLGEYSAYLLYELAEEEARTEGDVVTVGHRQRRPENLFRPFPFCTVDMQKEAFRLLHMSSYRAMDVAEWL